MLDHVSIPVAELARSCSFYDAVLEPLGARRRVERPGAVGYGTGPVPGFWLLEREATLPGPGLHACFHATTIQQVHAFHEIGLARGGRDAGSPGPRPQYVGGFYGAFLIDLDGYKVGATHRSQISRPG